MSSNELIKGFTPSQILAAHKAVCGQDEDPSVHTWQAPNDGTSSVDLKIKNKEKKIKNKFFFPLHCFIAIP